MSRTERAFDRRFRELLAIFGARDREKGVRWLFDRAARRLRQSGGSLAHALAEENVRLAELAQKFRPQKHECSRVICDAGLGGLARWLRASGFEAYWFQDITDPELVTRADELGACIITTDSFLLDRRAITQDRVRALWVPPTLTILEQLRLVKSELRLPESDSRCMRCGGELRAVDKYSVQERIPPKTFAWVNDYFECARCGQLFWEGTHWQNVTRRLQEVERGVNLASNS
jgi:uncharacterized protein